jgi:hypothetical protein
VLVYFIFVGNRYCCLVRYNFASVFLFFLNKLGETVTGRVLQIPLLVQVVRCVFFTSYCNETFCSCLHNKFYFSKENFF